LGKRNRVNGNYRKLQKKGGKTKRLQNLNLLRIMQPVVKGSSAVEKGVTIEKKASSMFCGPWEESAGRWAAAGLTGLVSCKTG